MKRILSLVLAIMLLLALGGCNKKQAEETTSAPPETTVATEPPVTEVPTTVPATTEAQTEPTEEIVPELCNPLTGEPLDAPYTARPYSVMINNMISALPQHGVSQADMVYEVLAEGGITRCFALFTDIQSVEKLGSIRSARPYYVDLAYSYDSIYVHAGGSEDGTNLIAALGMEDLDALKGYAGSAFYRDQGRLDRGVAYEHTLFTSGEKLIQCAKDQGYTLEREEGIHYGLHFTQDATPADGEKAEVVTVNFRSGGKKTVLTYNGETERYEAFQQGSDYIDGNTGAVLDFRNILVLETQTALSANGVTLEIELLGEGAGYFACGGKIIPIRWSHASKEAPFVYTLTNGEPLELGIGNSYVALVPVGSPVDCK